MGESLSQLAPLESCLLFIHTPLFAGGGGKGGRVCLYQVIGLFIVALNLSVHWNLCEFGLRGDRYV